MLRTIGNESGSIAPLGIGLILFTTSLMLTIIGATSMFIFQKRLTNLAEEAVIIAASGVASAEYFATKFYSKEFQELEVRRELLSDNVTTQVTVCGKWRAPIQILGMMESRQICSRALSRPDR